MKTYAVLLEITNKHTCKDFASLIGVTDIFEGFGSVLA